MGQVIYSNLAAKKIRTACDFYAKFDEKLGQQLRSTIVSSLNKLAYNPKIGRPCIENLAYRERIIPFGGSHFLALYRIEEIDGGIVILSIRHERELDYELEGDL